MPTNDRKINIYEKRLFSLTAIKTNFLDFLSDELDEVVSAIFQGTAGVLDDEEIGLLVDGANNIFKLDLTNASRVVVGTGQIIDLSQITGSSITEGIQWEDDGSSPYYVGIKFMEMPDGIETNPRSGDPEYPSLKQTYGEVDYPDSVTDNTTYIRLIINSITESGVDHSGRTIRVWLVDPVSHTEAVAYFEGTSGYAGGNNYVDIPYSGANGPLGQDTSVNPPSTTAVDYKVAIEGATWRKNTDLRTDSDYAFIGIMNSTGGVPTFNLSDQIPIFINTLDRAYDGATGSGSGRRIWVDGGAVELRTTSGASGDNMRGQLRLTRDGSTEDSQFMLQMIMEDETTIPIAVLEPLRDGSALQELEPVIFSGSSVVFTRGGIDLEDLGLRVNPNIHLLLISSADDSSDDGLYLINSVASSSVIGVRDLDGNAFFFTATTGQATILHPALVVTNSVPNSLVGSGVLDYWTGFLFTLRDGQKNDRTMRVLPEKGGTIIVYDHGHSSPSTYPDDIRPRELIVIDPDAVGQDLEWPIIFKRSVLINGGLASGATGEESYYARDGLRIYNSGSAYDDRDPTFGFVMDYGWPENVPTLHTWPSFAIDTSGGVCRGHNFRDDFLEYPHDVSGSLTSLGPYLFASSGGVGALTVPDIRDGAGYGHGCVEIATPAVAGASAELYQSCVSYNLDTNYDFRWSYRSRVKLMDSADVKYAHGFFQYRGGSPADTRRFFFLMNDDGNWYGVWEEGTSQYMTSAICGFDVGEYQWFGISISPISATFVIASKDNGANRSGSEYASIASMGGAVGAMGLSAYAITVGVAVEKSMVLDYWEVWDKEVLYGRFGTSHNQQHP